MKLLDKLKNALFEEEYVEVEEKPKKKAVKKEEKKVSVVKEKSEKPIAKKIVQPEKNEVDEELEEKSMPEENFDSYEPSHKKDFKFPMMDDKDFEIEELVMEPPHEPVKEEPVKTEQVTIKEKKSKPYGMDDFELPEPTYGLYERKDEKTYFKPSPIISPIYGILDKNYKKDDIKEKKEIRLSSSSYVHDNLDFETVRKKAYGTLTDDLKNEFGKDSDVVSTTEDDYQEDEQSQLVDLSTEQDTPEIKEITVADAEEYFEDLGLEYNVDYKDISKEMATGRRASKKKEEIEKPKAEEVKDTSVEIKSENDDDYIPNHITSKEIETSETDDKDIDDDNLFDLIDSMYDND